MNENGKTIIALENVCRSYTNFGTWNHVLKNLSMSIQEGEFAAIMGISGEGKSTLMRLLLGIDSISMGKAMICGHDFSTLKESQRSQIRATCFGYLAQEHNFLLDFSVYENFMIQGMASKIKIHEKDVKKLIDQLGIEEGVLSKRPDFLSGGELQRCALAKAVIHSPKILFMDEPTGNLNRANTNTLLDLLADLNKLGQTMVMVTHDIHAAIRANRVLYLFDGKIQDEVILGSFHNNSDLDERRHVLMDFLEKRGW